MKKKKCDKHKNVENQFILYLHKSGKVTYCSLEDDMKQIIADRSIKYVLLPVGLNDLQTYMVLDAKKVYSYMVDFHHAWIEYAFIVETRLYDRKNSGGRITIPDSKYTKSSFHNFAKLCVALYSIKRIENLNMELCTSISERLNETHRQIGINYLKVKMYNKATNLIYDYHFRINLDCEFTEYENLASQRIPFLRTSFSSKELKHISNGVLILYSREEEWDILSGDDICSCKEEYFLLDANETNNIVYGIYDRQFDAVYVLSFFELSLLSDMERFEVSFGVYEMEGGPESYNRMFDYTPTNDYVLSHEDGIVSMYALASVLHYFDIIPIASAFINLYSDIHSRYQGTQTTQEYEVYVFITGYIYDSYFGHRITHEFCINHLYKFKEYIESILGNAF